MSSANQNEEKPQSAFDFIRKCDPARVINVLQNESSRTAAIILSCMEIANSSLLLQNLDEKKQLEIALELSKEEVLPMEVVESIAADFKKKIQEYENHNYLTIGGLSKLVEILNLMDRESEKQLVQGLKISNSEVYTAVRHHMFVFEDIVILDDRAVQKILRNVDQQDLSKALKGVEQSVKDKVIFNMSKRAAKLLEEDMELIGPVRRKDIEESQLKIVSVIRRMEDSGEIVICRKEEMIK